MTLTDTYAPAPPLADPPPDPAPHRPRWVRPAVAALLAGTGLLYLWGLGSSGWANAFYSAAVQAGTKSWKAFFFGSLDASNSITVDKTPASLWVMELSTRIFGVNAWSILVPEALEGVAAVGLLYLTVRRWYGPVAGLVAGAAFALTPVAVLMFRFNNPDALLTLLLVAAAYALTRALEHASARWLALAGALIGFGFLTKMLQALLVVPGFALVYLVAAPTTPPRRVKHLLLAGTALVAAAGWWVAVVSLVPASDRPYIGGSQHNSVLELAFGYNGLGRLSGSETGSVGGGGPAGTTAWGQTGWTRLFTSDLGGQAAWLLPASLLLLAAGLWRHRRAARTDRARAGYLLWGGWLLVTAAVFSFMKGIFHPYYLVALAPAIAAVVGVGAVEAFRARRAVLLGIVTAATAATAYVLLGRSSRWQPWLAAVVIPAGLAVAAALLAIGRFGRRAALAAGGAALVVAFAGPAGYALDTAATPHTGAIPSAGPAVTGGNGPGGGGPGPSRAGGGFGQGPGGANGFGGAFGGNGSTNRPSGPGGGSPGGGLPGANRSGGPGGLGGAGGGLLDAATPSAAITSELRSGADRYRWVAAAVGANVAAGYQLASGDPVMAVGGFNGTDPSPTLARFQAYVAAGDIHYFIGGGGLGRANGGSGEADRIAAWVEQSFTARTIGGTTVYDLTGGAS